MSGWEQYFDKIICEINTGDDKDIYPYKYNNIGVRTPDIYIYRNKKAIILENNLPMPPTNSLKCMFCDCKLLRNIDALKKWDTRNIKSTFYMFKNCKSLRNIEALKNWDTRNIIVMKSMFNSCKSLRNIDALKNWNTNNVRNTTYMFKNCKLLSNIDGLKNWDMSKVENKYDMFKNCESLKIYPKNLEQFKSFTDNLTVIQNWDGVKINTWS